MRPYNILFSFENVPGAERGQQVGGLTMHILLLLGNIPLQKAFMQSTYFNHWPSSTFIDPSSWNAIELNTGTYLSSRDQILLFIFPIATIQNFTLFGSPSISGLIEN